MRISLNMNLNLKWILFLCLLALALPLCSTPLPVRAEAPDYDIPGGHFYTQTAHDGKGYSITDRDGVQFWSEFRRLGGVDALGYPVSQRFTLDGLMTQATQRVLLQWHPETGRVMFVNVFDILHDRGLDTLLETKYRIPPQATPNETGKSFSQIAGERLGWLNSDPAIRHIYEARPDALELWGLPTSYISATGSDFDIVRAQRAVIQYWKQNIPGIAQAGTVMFGLGGDIARDAGLVPQEAQVAELPGMNPELLRVLDRTNAYRSQVGCRPLTLNQQLSQAAQAHSQDMASHNFMSHTGSNGSSPWDRIQAAGYRFEQAAENVAAGYSTADAVVDAWYNSPQHRANMLNCNLQEIGLGLSDDFGRTDYRYYWVEDFGTR